MKAVNYCKLSANLYLSLCLFVCAAHAPAAELWQSLPATPALPSGAVARVLPIRGVQIWCADWDNNARKGDPVLLLHGGAGSSNYFGKLISALVEKGYRVIAMDSRGHGRSTRSEESLTYEQMSEDVVALLDALKIPRVSIVGWSDGGIIGFELALHHPNRIARLFAFGANSEPSGTIDGGDKTPTYVAYLARAESEYRALSPTPDQWPSFKAALNVMWSTLPAITTAELRSIKTPVTIADGEHDEVIKAEHTRYLAATIPRAHLVILPNVSHFAMLQDPAEFNAAVIMFLKR